MTNDAGEIGLLDMLMDSAVLEAVKLNHEFVGTEHLLVACLTHPNEDVREFANQNRLTVRSVRRAIKKRVGVGPISVSENELPLTARAIKAIEVSEKLAELHSKAWDVHYLLLGLLHDRQSICAELLSSVGVRDETLDEIVKAACQFD